MEVHKGEWGVRHGTEKRNESWRETWVGKVFALHAQIPRPTEKELSLIAHACSPILKRQNQGVPGQWETLSPKLRLIAPKEQHLRLSSVHMNTQAFMYTVHHAHRSSHTTVHIHTVCIYKHKHAHAKMNVRNSLSKPMYEHCARWKEREQDWKGEQHGEETIKQCPFPHLSIQARRFSLCSDQFSALEFPGLCSV